MIRRGAKILGWTAAGAILAAGTAGGGLVWRLAQGPIALEELAPYVGRALSDPQGRYTVEIGGLVLSWVDEEHATGLTRLDLRALRVRAVNTEGAELAAVPELGVGFSVKALVQGRLSPTRLELVRPRLQVLRRADGSLDFDVRTDAASTGQETEAAEDGTDFSDEILATLFQPPDIGRPLGLLRSLTITGADLTVVNRMLGLSWHASRADIALTRDAAAIRGTARLALDLAGQGATVEAQGIHRMDEATTELSARFEGMEPAALATLGPALAPLAAARLPIGGRVEASLDPRFQPVRVGFELHGGAGTVSVPELRPEPLRVAGFRAGGALDIAGRAAVLDRLAVELDGMALTAAGRLSERGDRREGGLRLELAAGGRVARLEADGVQTAGKGATLGLRLSDLEPAALAGFAPLLQPLAAAALPLSGTAELEFGPDHRPRAGRAELSAGPGRIDRPDLFPQPVTVAAAALRVSGDRASGRLDVERFALDLGGPRVEGTARATETAGQLAADAEVAARDLPIDDLRRYWPLNVSPNAREWVTTNLSHGLVHEAVANLTVAGPLDRPEAIDATRFHATMRGEGVTVNYFRPLPPVTGAGVEAATDGKSFTIHTKGGRIDDVQVGDGTAVIGGLDTGKEVMDIRIPLRGPVRTILTVLDSPPLGYPSRLDLDPKRTQGQAEAQLHFHFPLLADLKVEDLDLGVTAKLRGVAVEKVAAGLNATDGDLSLALDMKSMSIKGNTKLDGVPVAIDWKEQFESTAKGPRTRIAVKGDVDARDLRSHGIDLGEHVEGPLGADVLFTIDQRHRFALSAGLNLEKTRLLIRELGWEKAPGVPGSGKLALEFQKDRVTRVTGLTVDAGGLRAQATVDLAPQTMAVTRVRVPQLTVGQTNLRADVTVREGNGYAGTLSGESLDARALVSNRKDAPDGPDKGGGEGGQIPLDFAIRFNRVVFGDGRHLRDVAGSLRRDTRSWTNLDVNARTGRNSGVRLRYQPAAQGFHEVSIQADDAGEALRALDLTDRLTGGSLHISGRTVEPRADAAIEGSVELRDYTLTDPPVLARILNAVSPAGFAELMGGGKGINFGRLAAKYRKEGRLLTLKDLRTSGSALGLTLEGEVDLVTDTANLRGTIVPIYGLNRLIGQIPLLGDVLSGGEGQGIFSATWHVQGPLGDPDVTVNPLAMLAPGFLRNLFFLGDGKSSAEPPPENPYMR